MCVGYRSKLVCTRWKRKKSISSLAPIQWGFCFTHIDKRPAQIHSGWNEVEGNHNKIIMCRKKTIVNVFYVRCTETPLSRRFVSDIYVTKDVRVNETGSPSVHL